jgi:dipeptidase
MMQLDVMQENLTMGCDMMAALPIATGAAHALFGVNAHRPAKEELRVRSVPGRTFALGERLCTQFLEFPQVRQTCTVLAVQPRGQWGYLFGVNDRGVAVACSDWQSRFLPDTPGLLGPELVRLTLERSHSANHALEVVTDLIARHGQGRFAASPEGQAGDHVFLLADPAEAFVVEAAGAAWAAQEITQVRAAGDVGVIRQDWNKLAPGLAELAIRQGLWAEDGSKVDFSGTLSESPTGQASALRRWGRLTLLLEQQNGHIDLSSVRQILADHYDGTHYEADPLAGPSPITPLCRHALHGLSTATAASAVMQLPGLALLPSICWTALGPPCLGVHFPLLIDGNLPAAFGEDSPRMWSNMQRVIEHVSTVPRRWLRVREAMGRLQTRFEQDVEELLDDWPRLRQHGQYAQLRRLASSLMECHVERFEEIVEGILGEARRPVALATSAAGGFVDF